MPESQLGTKISTFIVKSRWTTIKICCKTKWILCHRPPRRIFLRNKCLDPPIPSAAGHSFTTLTGVWGHELRRSDQTAGRQSHCIPTADAAHTEPWGAAAVCAAALAGVNLSRSLNQRKDPLKRVMGKPERYRSTPRALRLYFAFYCGFYSVPRIVSVWPAAAGDAMAALSSHPLLLLLVSGSVSPFCWFFSPLCSLFLQSW